MFRRASPVAGGIERRQGCPTTAAGIGLKVGGRGRDALRRAGPTRTQRGLSEGRRCRER